MDTYSVYDTNGDEYEVLIRDLLTPEDVYEHIIMYRAYALISGEDPMNIEGVDGWFLEELKWQHI